MSDKTEKPTRKRIRDARRKGEVLNSRELTAAISYFVVLGSMIALLPWLWKRLQRLFDLVWSNKGVSSTLEAWPELLAALAKELADLALPMALIAAAASAVSAFVQVGGIFSADPVLP